MILENKEITRTARNIFRKEWKRAIIAMLVSTVINLASAYILSYILLMIFGDEPLGSAITLVLRFVLQSIVTFGLILFFLSLVRNAKPKIKLFFSAFSSKYILKVILASLLMGIIIFLWGLLLIIPGIIVGLSYILVMYIIADNPGIKISVALKQSQAMMKGQIMKAFLLYLRFFGWTLLFSVPVILATIASANAGERLYLPMLLSFLFLIISSILFIAPYAQISLTLFYQNLKDEYENKKAQENITSPEVLNDTSTITSESVVVSEANTDKETDTE